MKTRRLLLVAAVLLGPGCSEEDTNALPQEWWFNNKLRADLLPLTATQSTPGEDPRTPFEPMLIDDGSSNATVIVSDVSLSRTGEYAAAALQNTSCLWLSPKDEIKLHWESAIRLATPPDEVQLEPGRDVVGMCTFTDPYTRQGIADVEGVVNEESPYDHGAEEFKNVRVEVRTAPPLGGFDNEFDACLAPTSAALPALSDGWCSPTFTGEHESCNEQGCEFPVVEDAQFELANVLEGVEENRKLVEPLIKRVHGTRQLVRPLTDHGSGVAFSWAVDVLPDDRWSENFSSNVKVNTVRVFGLTTFGQRVYLAPTGGWIGTTHCVVTSTDDHALRCNGNDTSSFDLTPAYAHTDPLTQLRWRVDFTADPRRGVFAPDAPCCIGTPEQCCDGGVCPPICGSEDPVQKLQSQLYIEFTLFDLEHTEPDVFASPRALDFGLIQWGTKWTQKVTIENTGGEVLSVTDVDLADNIDPAFEYRLPTSVTLPLTLMPGDHVTVDVTALPSAQITQPQARLVVKARTIGTAPTFLESDVALRYEMYRGPQLFTSWSGAEDSNGEMHFCENGDLLGLLVWNDGDRDLMREAYEITPAMSSFTVTPFGSASSLAKRTLAPGDGETYQVHFLPDQSGSFEQTAELRADADAANTPTGDIVIPLRGFLDTWQNQPTCTPNAE